MLQPSPVESSALTIAHGNEGDRRSNVDVPSWWQVKRTMFAIKIRVRKYQNKTSQPLSRDHSLLSYLRSGKSEIVAAWPRAGWIGRVQKGG